jgi:hypothetical protein
MTDAEAAEQTANRAEQTANRAEKTAARPLIPEQNEINENDGLGTPLFIGESQGGTTITLALRTPERLYRSHNLVSSLASDAPNSSKPQVQPPASTAPARIEEGPRKRRRMRNQLYRDS